MSHPSEDDPDGAIQRYASLPLEIPGRPVRRGFWAAFCTWFRPRLEMNADLGQDYLAAKVGEQKARAAEAQAKATQAVAVAAKLDAEADIVSQQAVQEFAKTVDQLKLDDDATADALKLAKLFERNPAIAAQLDKVNEMAATLRARHGTRIQVCAAGEFPEVVPAGLLARADEAGGAGDAASSG